MGLLMVVYLEQKTDTLSVPMLATASAESLAGGWGHATDAVMVDSMAECLADLSVAWLAADSAADSAVDSAVDSAARWEG